MTLRLYNTLTKAKEDFAPLDKANVRMYVCGPTVYDFAHIGNARPVIVFDVLYRLLRHEYGADHVTYVRNITDVDDKINARAAERGVTIRELTEETARIFNEDVVALGCLPPTETPRATDNIAPMIAMIEKLIANGHAYAAEGHVLFDVSSKLDYGKLARRSLDEMIAGARVEVAPYKKSPMDFVLWKPSDAATPGWESPWGRGRPGWHIECSAMAGRYLGETFDIHGGGIDLVFPHHENEIAQSEAAHHGHPLAKIWMHNGFLQVEGEKMAKSAGNFVTIRDLIEDEKFGNMKWSGDAVRLAMLMTHYRQPIDWTVERLAAAGNNLWTFNLVGSKGLKIHDTTDVSAMDELANGRVSEGLLNELNDDLNTSSAVLAHLFSLVRQADQKGGVLFEPAKQLIIDCLFLGIDPFRFVRHERLKLKSSVLEINHFIELRNAARARKNFAESDRIRDELLAQGIVLKDGPTGTTWEVKR